MDEFKAFNIEKEKSVKTAIPILKDAYAAYECKLVDSRHYGDHIWMVGEVVAVHFIEEAFTPKGMLDLKAVKPFLHLGPDCYISTDVSSVHIIERGT